jgi:hypothetical protein
MELRFCEPLIRGKLVIMNGKRQVVFNALTVSK